MVPIKTLPGRLVYIMLMSVFLYGCKKGNTDSSLYDNEYDVVHTEMRYFDFDQVGNLSVFFDSIRNVHPISIRIEEDAEFIEKNVLGCIKRIDGYRHGTNRYYPDSLVRGCIDFFGFECAIIDNHGPGVDMTYAEWFLMMAAYYSPDITCLVHMQTPNHRAGVQNFGSQYNPNPWWSYVFLKRNKGFEVRRICGDYTKIERIYQLQDENNRLYYLCSNNSSIVGFQQVLFWEKSGENIICVAQCDSLPVKNTCFDQCYFNIEKRAWYCCNKDKKTNKLIPLSENPALVLKLDGDDSCFKVIENQ